MSDIKYIEVNYKQIDLFFFNTVSFLLPNEADYIKKEFHSILKFFGFCFPLKI